MTTKQKSAAELAAIERRTLQKPLLVKGISGGELVEIKVSQFGRLDVDPAYQRGETNMIAQITRALKAGGKVFDPVTLCERRGSDKLWIVDGHQRTCAFQDLKIPFAAMVYQSEDADAEHALFLVMNARRAVHANVIVKAWTGPCAALLRKANDSFEHPLYGRVNFSQSSKDSKLAASSLVRAMLVATGTQKAHAGSAHELLSRLDIALSDKSLNRAKAEHYLRLIGKVAPEGTLPALVLRGIAFVAHQRWQKDVVMPSSKVVDRLAAKNWTGELLIEKYFGVLCDTIAKIWRV